MRILAIETSCDETSIALVECSGGLSRPRFNVLRNIVSSQIAAHRPFGGVVPSLAKREHQKNLPLVLRKILQVKSYASAPVRELMRSKNSSPHELINPSTVDAVAVTVGPGLEPALWTGIEFAKELHKKLNSSPSTSLRASRRRVALLGANHMEGHLYSTWLPARGKFPISPPASRLRRAGNFPARLRMDEVQAGGQIPKVPAVALVVSGGHTILLKMDSLTKWKKLGETRDDAAGEAFDKVARMLGFPYPGGPEIEKLALRQTQGERKIGTISFPRPMLNAKNYDFSFSGLKTSVLYYLRDHPRARKEDVAASFQAAVIDVLVAKTMRAAREYGAKSVFLSGGVAANRALRNGLTFSAKRLAINFHVPPFEYNTDNAAMIAAAAYIGHLKKKKYRLVAQPNLNL